MSYGFEWIPVVVLVRALVVPDGACLRRVGLVVVALATVAALAVLAGAILASPFLLARALRRRLAERHASVQGPAPVAGPLAHQS